MSENDEEQEMVTVYEAAGGEDYFVRLIDRFFDRVSNDDLLMTMYPPDLTMSRQNMVEFLVQYWGGPSTYSDRKGHPRLRMRHTPFSIDEEARDVWVRYMMEAVDEEPTVPEIRKMFDQYFNQAGTAMVNRQA